MRDTIAESAALLFALDDSIVARECWLLDLSRRIVTVVDLQAPGDCRRSFAADERVQSTVLPEFRTEAREFFE
jgi:hypothetical protein